MSKFDDIKEGLQEAEKKAEPFVKAWWSNVMAAPLAHVLTAAVAVLVYVLVRLLLR